MADAPEKPIPPWKWVGGKRKLLRKRPDLFPPRAEVQRLVLPFCGGGAMAFHYASLPMLLSDTEPRLMAAYVAVRDHVEELLTELRFIVGRGYTRANYDACIDLLQDAHAAPLAQRAAWLFVLTQWGFNGLLRMNQKGGINVPMGKPSKPGTIPPLFDEANLRACSKALAAALFGTGDFLDQVARAEPRRGDLVYLDPPFVPSSKTANFVGYGAKGFGPADQERLAALLPELDRAGIRWALSNSETPEARKLFCQPRPGWNVVRIKRTGTISSKTDGREAVGEILVRNYGSEKR